MLNTVSIVLTINNALDILRDPGMPNYLCDAAQQAILAAFSQGTSNGTSNISERDLSVNCNLTLKSVPIGTKVRAIAAIRNNLGWGLKEAKDWVEVVTGKAGWYNQQGEWIPSIVGTPNTLILSRSDVDAVSNDLRKIGCEFVVDDYGCW